MSVEDHERATDRSDPVPLASPRPGIEPSRRIVVAGHRLNFFEAVMRVLEGAGHVLALDRWAGHRKHDERRSRELLDWAEVVVCEFCLGNAIWYATHVRPEQRLLVHFHRFEIDKPYPADLDIDAVDAVVFAGPHFRDEAREQLGWPAEKTLYVPNAVDLARFDRPKHPEARFTLGLLGWHRQLKRLDLALDLLERLRRRDARFRLLVKGAHPRDLWVWRHDVERSYFERELARIGHGDLEGAVELEEPDEHVEEWFRRVGFILSPSDLESFHLAVAEGMAARSVPVIRARPGAVDLFPGSWIHPDVDAMADAVADLATGGWAEAGAEARAFVAATYGLEVVGRAWRALVLGVPPSSLADRDRPGVPAPGVSPGP